MIEGKIVQTGGMVREACLPRRYSSKRAPCFLCLFSEELLRIF